MKNSMKHTDSYKRHLLTAQMQHRLREGWLLVTVACALFLFVAFISYRHSDPGWSSTGLDHQVMNWGGYVGAWVADLFLSLFGLVAYLLIILMIPFSLFNAQEGEPELKRSYEWVYKCMGWVCLFGSSCALVDFYLSTQLPLPARTGGIIGHLFSHSLLVLFNQVGSTLLLITILLCGITLVTGFSWIGVMRACSKGIGGGWCYLYRFLFRRSTWKDQKLRWVESRPIFAEPTLTVREALPVMAMTDLIPIEFHSEKEPMDLRVQLASGSLPSHTLLNLPAPGVEKPFTHITFEELSLLVEQRLSDFGVAAKVVAVLPGPIITRFELELAPGIKVSKITGLAKDIARSLSVVSVRVVEVIPGKSVIGLEIPNENRQLVTLRDLFESPRFIQARSPVSLVLGRDISGHPVVVDLAKMPHLLVAGTTGSGKSVSLNVMLLSMLFKASPEQLRFIMIDPKMLELSVYDGIPHLLTPVITDMKHAANALRWGVAEMDRRYRLMATLGVRHLAGYNQKVSEAIKQGQPISMSSMLVKEEAMKVCLQPLPMIVIIVDELADMMMVVGKKVEDLIARIAQKARAAGIYLIVATQRPSVDVITGLIKANIPTRIAFQVSSRIDSRTIIDQQGAEQLLGHGDMLYLPPGTGVPIRVHGAYVTDEEVHRVVAAWRSSGQPDYLDEITSEIDEARSGEGGNLGEQDPLYDDAVRVVVESRRASISLVQRRLRIGYNRAARIIEEMEAAGVVSSLDRNGTREVLVTAPPVD